MARRRMIAPEIWQSEDFSKLSLLAKLLFIGMFSQADDEGRGRAKPVYLKSILFPYDEKLRVADVETALSEIALNMSVALYSVAGSNYYEFQNWDKWQTIDRPKPSEIPPREAEKPHDEAVFPAVDEQSEKNRGRIDEGSTIDRRSVDDESAIDRCLKRKEEEKKGKEEEEKGGMGEKENKTPASPSPAPYETIKDLYNSVCTSFPRCTALSEKRKKAIKARFTEGYTLDSFQQLFAKAEASAFLKGKNSRDWTATFDWLINGNNMAKVLDGNYDNRGGYHGAENTAGNGGDSGQSARYGTTI